MRKEIFQTGQFDEVFIGVYLFDFWGLHQYPQRLLVDPLPLAWRSQSRSMGAVVIAFPDVEGFIADDLPTNLHAMAQNNYL